MGAERVVVVGASGFGRECLDVLEAMIDAGADIEILGVLDDAPSEVNLGRLDHRGVKYLGRVDDWLAAGVQGARFVLGIGAPAVRKSLACHLEAAGHRAFTAIHPSATFGARTAMAAGVVVCAGAAVSNNVTLGRHVHINPNATIGHDSYLQDYVSVNPAATISGDVLVESLTLVGAGAILLQGLRVGASSTVGAGCVVTKNVPASVVVKGVPGVWATPLAPIEITQNVAGNGFPR